MAGFDNSYAMGLGCVKMLSQLALECDDQGAVWGPTQTQPTILYRNTAYDLDNPTQLAQSFGTGLVDAKITSITALTGNGVTATATANNDLVAGMTITISGASPAGFNGVQTVASANSTSFTFSNVTNATATGTITCTQNLRTNANWLGVKNIGSGVLLGWVGVSADSKYHLFRTHNYGTSFGTNNNNDRTSVLRLGDVAGVQSADVSILGTRGVCVANVAGGTKILVGEYNVNSSRVTGSTNDQVRIYQSTDLGKTWTTLITWNTDGTNQVRHVHLITQDPYSGYVYIGLGDSSTSGLIRWDGVSSAPPANTKPENFGNYPGWLGIGAGNYTNYTPGSGASNVDVFQVTDLIFTQDWIYNPADNGTSAANNRGMWRFKRDFTRLNRVYDNSSRTGHSMYWGLKHSTGVLFQIEIGEATTTDGICYVHSSIDDGNTWTECAKFPFSSVLSGSVDGFFERSLDKSIWVSTNGKNTYPNSTRNGYVLYPTRLLSPINSLSI